MWTEAVIRHIFNFQQCRVSDSADFEVLCGNTSLHSKDADLFLSRAVNGRWLKQPQPHTTEWSRSTMANVRSGDWQVWEHRLLRPRRDWGQRSYRWTDQVYCLLLPQSADSMVTRKARRAAVGLFALPLRSYAAAKANRFHSSTKLTNFARRLASSTGSTRQVTKEAD